MVRALPPSLPPSPSARALPPPSSASYSSHGLSLEFRDVSLHYPELTLLPSLSPSLSPRPAPSLLRLLLFPRPLPRVPRRLLPLPRATACFWSEARLLQRACGHHHCVGKEGEREGGREGARVSAALISTCLYGTLNETSLPPSLPPSLSP